MKLSSLIGFLALSLLPVPLLAGTTVEFRKTTGGASPGYRSTSIYIPNETIINKASDLEPTLEQALRAAILEDPYFEGGKIDNVGALDLTIPTPTVRVTGSGQDLLVVFEGISRLHTRIYVRPDSSAVRAICGSSIRAMMTVNNLSLVARYDYLEGSIRSVNLEYRNISVDADCSRPLGIVALKLAEVFAPDKVNFEQMVRDQIAEGFDVGRVGSLFSLGDSLRGYEVSGNRAIRQASDDAISYLTGVKESAAAEIARLMRNNLIERLRLTGDQQRDLLITRLSGLDAYILRYIDDIDSLDLRNAGLSNYLNTKLPNLESYLLGRLNGTYSDAVSAISGIEQRAYDALEQAVSADWSNISGGINLRVRVLLGSKRVIVDAYHTAPSTFVGRAEAVAPCNPLYSFSGVQNASNYSVYNAVGDLYASGLARSYRTRGLLSKVVVKGRQGLYSYPKSSSLEHYNWGDYYGPRPIIMPVCPIAGQPSAPTNPNPSPTSAPQPPFNPDPPAPPGGHPY